MSAANRRAGSRYETDLLKHFRDAAFETERQRTAGKEDEGDLSVRVADDLRLVIEAKAGKNVRPRYWYDDEAVPEAANYAKRRGLPEETKVIPVLLMKAHGKGTGKSLAVVDLDDLTYLVHRGEGR